MDDHDIGESRYVCVLSHFQLWAKHYAVSNLRAHIIQITIAITEPDL